MGSVNSIKSDPMDFLTISSTTLYSSKTILGDSDLKLIIVLIGLLVFRILNNNKELRNTTCAYIASPFHPVVFAKH